MLAMKRTLLAMVSVAYVLCVPATAQQSPDALTYGGLTGRAWQQLSQIMKWIYIQAVDDTTVAAMAHAVSSPCKTEAEGFARALTPEGMTGEEARRAIDRFYEPPENLLIAIVDVYEIVGARARGVPERVVQRKIAEMRKAASAERR